MAVRSTDSRVVLPNERRAQAVEPSDSKNIASPIRQPYEDEAASGGSFVVRLLAGTVLGAGLAMIFGPGGSLSPDAASTPTGSEQGSAPATGAREQPVGKAAGAAGAPLVGADR
jgi:hypothetical protein